PADQLPAARREEGFEASHEPALQRRRVLDAELAHARLHGRRLDPAFLDGLVAADVHVLARKELEHFVENRLQRLERDFVDAEEPGVNAPVGGDARGHVARAELGVGGERGLRVTRHVDLRDDGDVARRRMRDDVTYVLFRVEAAVTPRLAGFGIDVFGGGGAGGHAPRADLRELRIRVDGDAPALV